MRCGPVNEDKPKSKVFCQEKSAQLCSHVGSLQANALNFQCRKHKSTPWQQVTMSWLTASGFTKCKTVCKNTMNSVHIHTTFIHIVPVEIIELLSQFMIKTVLAL